MSRNKGRPTVKAEPKVEPESNPVLQPGEVAVRTAPPDQYRVARVQVLGAGTDQMIANKLNRAWAEGYRYAGNITRDAVESLLVLERRSVGSDK